MSTTPSIVIHAESVHLHGSAPTVGIDVSTLDKPGLHVAQEVRDLGGGERITQAEALAELKELGDGWRLEMPHELFALVDYGHKNQHGAYARDPGLKDGWYWTSQETPWFEGGRVVVGFVGGDVDGDVAYDRAFARAVRVSGQ